jgi:hypothetical protein
LRLRTEALGRRERLDRAIRHVAVARNGEPLELVVDTERLHFFDPDDGSGIYGAVKAE